MNTYIGYDSNEKQVIKKNRETTNLTNLSKLKDKILLYIHHKVNNNQSKGQVN